MDGRSVELSVEALDEATVARAAACLELQLGQEIVVALLGAAGETVRLALQQGEVKSLSADGTLLVFGEPAGHGLGHSLCLQELGSGRRTWFREQDRAGDFNAAISPDHQSIVTLRHGEGGLRLTVIDVATGGRRTVWADPDGAPQHLSLSADGKLAAVTQLHWPDEDEEVLTLVIDLADGRVRHQIPYYEIVGFTHSSWIADRTLLLAPYYDERPLLLDVETGQTRPVDLPDGSTVGTLPGRLLWFETLEPTEHRPLLSTALDGTGTRTLFALGPGHGLRRLLTASAELWA